MDIIYCGNFMWTQLDGERSQCSGQVIVQEDQGPGTTGHLILSTPPMSILSPELYLAIDLRDRPVGTWRGGRGGEGRGDTGGQVWLVAMPGRPGLVSVGQPASRVSLVSWPGLDSNETWPVVATHSTLHSRILRHKGN